MHTPFTRADWLVPSLLILLCALPIAVGAVRLVELVGGVPMFPDNARSDPAPAPAVLHILGSGVFCILGAFQFAPGIRGRWPGWHRRAGRVLVASGLVAALSGVWLTLTHAPADGDGPVLFALRIAAGAAMTFFLVLGVAAIRRRDIARHRAWMMRGYAIGLGAGTQVLVHVPWMLMFGEPDEPGRALLTGAAWAINLAVAEWIVRRQPVQPRPSDRAPHSRSASLAAGG